MKLITDTVYGHQRAHIGAIAVIMTSGTHGMPTAAVCVGFDDDSPAWYSFRDSGIPRCYIFQPDPSKLQPGEWCWPASGCEPATIRDQTDADALYGSGAFRMSESKPQIYKAPVADVQATARVREVWPVSGEMTQEQALVWMREHYGSDSQAYLSPEGVKHVRTAAEASYGESFIGKTWEDAIESLEDRFTHPSSQRRYAD